MKRKINCAEAKQVSIIHFLVSHNCYPTRISRQTEYWYCSPLRDEKHASFKVDALRNQWYDFGIGSGGNLIDLVMRLHHLTDISAALNIIANQQNSFSFHQHSSPALQENFGSINLELKVSRDIEIKKVRNLGYNQAITDYLLSRNIEMQIASKYLNEIYYQVGQKHYFSVGFKNNSGGWETRNKFFKGCIGAKDITTFINGHHSIAVFEGFSDFLSALQLRILSTDKTDILVLNSNALVDRAIEVLKDYKEAFLYLDNDNSGTLATKKIIEAIPIAKDERLLYQNIKDLNDFLKSKLVAAVKLKLTF